MTARQIWVENRAKILLEKYKISKKWTFCWNRRKTVYGYCCYTDKKIYLSSYFVEAATKDQIIDTILHEIAHIIAGENAGHGPKWKKVCKRIGAIPKRCCKAIEGIPFKYEGVCPLCKTIYRAQRRLQNMDKRLCQKVGCDAEKYDKYVIWKENR